MLRIAVACFLMLTASVSYARPVHIPADAARATISVDAAVRPGASLVVVMSDTLGNVWLPVNVSVPDDIPNEIYDAIDIILTSGESIVRTGAPLREGVADIRLEIAVDDTCITSCVKGSAMKKPVTVSRTIGNPAAIDIESNDEAEIKDIRFDCETLASLSRAPFASVDELYSYLDASDDPNEALWAYFDRNTDPLKSSLGGKYLLATVATSTGYDIVYISGAETNASLWEPLTVKGHLIRDSLPGSFTMEWIDADGNLVNYETTATIAGNILSLAFPYWKSQLRFVKRTE